MVYTDRLLCGVPKDIVLLGVRHQVSDQVLEWAHLSQDQAEMDQLVDERGHFPRMTVLTSASCT